MILLEIHESFRVQSPRQSRFVLVNFLVDIALRLYKHVLKQILGLRKFPIVSVVGSLQHLKILLVKIIVFLPKLFQRWNVDLLQFLIWVWVWTQGCWNNLFHVCVSTWWWVLWPTVRMILISLIELTLLSLLWCGQFLGSFLLVRLFT